MIACAGVINWPAAVVLCANAASIAVMVVVHMLTTRRVAK